MSTYTFIHGPYNENTFEGEKLRVTASRTENNSGGVTLTITAVSGEKVAEFCVFTNDEDYADRIAASLNHIAAEYKPDTEAKVVL
jgi:hypothetical protein